MERLRDQQVIQWLFQAVKVVPWLSLGGSTFQGGEAVRFRCLPGTISDHLAAARRAG